MLTHVAVCLTMKQIIFPFPRAQPSFTELHEKKGPKNENFGSSSLFVPFLNESVLYLYCTQRSVLRNNGTFQDTFVAILVSRLYEKGRKHENFSSSSLFVPFLNVSVLYLVL